MANINDFLGPRKIAEFKVHNKRISPLGEPVAPVNPDEEIEFIRIGANKLKCDLSKLKNPVPSEWNSVVFTRSGNEFIGTVGTDHSHFATLRRFTFAQPRGKKITGIECEIGPENAATHMGVWHAPD